MDNAEKRAWLYREFGKYDPDRSGEFLVPIAEARLFVEFLAQLDIEWIDAAELFRLEGRSQVWEETVYFGRSFSLDEAINYAKGHSTDSFAVSFFYDIFDDIPVEERAVILSYKSPRIGVAF